MINELTENPADILLIVPPFSQIEIQSLAMHTLQAYGRKAGFTIKIFYANIHFNKLLGSEYNNFCEMNYFLLGERMFARAAWGDKTPNPINNDIQIQYHI